MDRMQPKNQFENFNKQNSKWSPIGCMIVFFLLLFLFAPVTIFLIQAYHNKFELKPYLLWLIPYAALVVISILYRWLKRKFKKDEEPKDNS